MASTFLACSGSTAFLFVNAYDRPVFSRGDAPDDVFAARLVDAVVIRVAQENILGGVDQARGLLSHGVFQIGVDPVAGKENIVFRGGEEERQDIRQSFRAVDHEIHDSVIALCEHFPQNSRIGEIGPDVIDIGKIVFLFIKGDGVHAVSHFREAGNKILSHGAGRA